jgi:hypothetical protein
MSTRLWRFKYVFAVTVFILAASCTNVATRDGQPVSETVDSDPPRLFLPSHRDEEPGADPIEVAKAIEAKREAAGNATTKSDRGELQLALRNVGFEQIEVQLTNRTKRPIIIDDWQGNFVDHIWFVFRDPNGRVVNGFCYAGLRSAKRTRPPNLVLKPDESRTSGAFLWVVANYYNQRLPAGRYSLEAIYSNEGFVDEPAADEVIVARSNRVAVQVGDAKKRQ